MVLAEAPASRAFGKRALRSVHLDHALRAAGRQSLRRGGLRVGLLPSATVSAFQLLARGHGFPRRVDRVRARPVDLLHAAAAFVQADCGRGRDTGRAIPRYGAHRQLHQRADRGLPHRRLVGGAVSRVRGLSPPGGPLRVA